METNNIEKEIKISLSQATELQQSIQRTCIDNGKSQRYIVIAKVLHVMKMWFEMENEKLNKKSAPNSFSNGVREVLNMLDNGEISVRAEVTDEDIEKFKDILINNKI